MSSPLSKRSRRRGRALVLFAQNFLRHPRMLGSLIPSSRFLVRRALDRVDWNRARVVVEYGAGVGTFTTEILRRMRSDAVLIAFETNAEFVRFLRESLPDPRLCIVQGSAADIRTVLERLGRDAADYIISGIPFSTIPGRTRDAILAATAEALRPDGMLIVYQFTGRVAPHLRRFFKQVSDDFEPRNILPARLFYCSSPIKSPLRAGTAPPWNGSEVAA